MTLPLTIDQPAYFDRLADVESRHWWSLSMWQLASYWLDDALRGRRGLRALDIGCGTGMTLWRLAERPEISEAVGLDPSRAALAHARRFPLRWVCASALALPFAEGTIDVITCFDVLQHLDADGDCRATCEIARVLRPSGVALIRSNARRWCSNARGQGREYELGELTSLVEHSGLMVRRATHANCLPAAAHEARSRLRLFSPAGSDVAGLKIRVPSAGVNSVMRSVAGSEALIAGRLGVALPFGHSTLVLAKKQDPSTSSSMRAG
jgi:SAM-dependent methyltransferase